MEYGEKTGPRSRDNNHWIFPTLDVYPAQGSALQKYSNLESTAHTCILTHEAPLSRNITRFDAYTATTSSLTAEDVFPWITAVGGIAISGGRGFHTFNRRISMKDEAGDEVGAISYAGRQKDLIMIEIKGEKTDEVVSRLRQNAPHRCTRVDVCIDFEHAGVFGILHDIVMRMKRDFRLIGERLGDWDYPEQGRTQYVGSKNSPVRVRLYEKGKQPKLVHLNRPHLTRLELQVRPTKEAKDLYSSLSPDDVWGASKWTRHLAGELNILDLQSCPPGTVRKSSQSEFALQHMVRQYSRHLTALAEDTGSWACMGLTLQEMIKANRAPLRH